MLRSRLLPALAARFRRERVRAFAGFLWRRFLDDRCFESAGAMAYSTVFALVPLTAVLFGVVSAFPVFESWLDTLTRFVFANFVPQAARTVEEYLLEFAGSARGLTSLGGITVLATAVLMLKSSEDTFNRIWRVRAPRSRVARFLVYWTVLTLGPLLILGGLALSSYFLSLPLVSETASDIGLGERVLRLLPTAVELVGFTLAYAVIPNRSVPIRHALAGGLLATILFELAKSAFAAYLTNANFGQLYGAVAVLPIFLIWIYLSWVVILLGASVAASLGAFRFQPAALRLPRGHEIHGLLRLAARLLERQREGRAWDAGELLDAEPCLTDELLAQLLGDLEAADIVRRDEEGSWLLARDPGRLSLAELVEATRLRVPLSASWLPCSEDDLGRRSRELLDGLRTGLHAQLDRPLSGLVPAPDPDGAPKA